MSYTIFNKNYILYTNYFAVVLAGLWGWVFWRQIPDAWSVVGSALVICGGLLTIYLSRPSATEPV